MNVVKDLRERLIRAEDELRSKVTKWKGLPEAVRLRGVAQGVGLALDYLRAYDGLPEMVQTSHLLCRTHNSIGSWDNRRCGFFIRSKNPNNKPCQLVPMFYEDKS